MVTYTLCCEIELPPGYQMAWTLAVLYVTFSPLLLVPEPGCERDGSSGPNTFFTRVLMEISRAAC